MVKQAKRRPSSVERTGTVLDAISGACSDLVSLGEECREVHDNMPESLQQGQRGSTLDETADTLESVSEPDVPAPLQDLPCKWYEQLPKRKGRGLSRSGRRDNAVAALEAAIDAVENYSDLIDEAKGAVAGGTATPDQQRMVGAQVEAHDNGDSDGVDTETLASELGEIKDNAEGCEFPGMYG